MQLSQRLRGMEDYGPNAVSMRGGVSRALSAFLARYGYQEVETPILEPTELLLRKSGGELASKMYTFTDPGGRRVSLRPEFTSSVVRAYIQGLDGDNLPVRWSYMGPVFRYEPEEGADYRQFTQVGAEIIGTGGPWADAEVLAMASKGLSNLGMTGHQLVLGHLGFIGALLESLGLSDRARLFLLSSLPQLRSGPEGVGEVSRRAQELGLLPEEGVEAGARAESPDEAAMELLERYPQAAASPIIGVRTPEEVRERFLRKQMLGQDTERFGRALELMAEVAQARGEPGDTLGRVRELVGVSQSLEALDSLAETLKALSHYQLDGEVSLDFGLGRGIAYYSGVVFEVRGRGPDGNSMGGGGRYDGLLQAFGGQAYTPAMGFAWSLERIVDCLLEQRGDVGTRTPGIEALLVRPASSNAGTAALLEAERLRTLGNIVELEMDARSLSDCLRYAAARKMSQVITVDSEGQATRQSVS